MNGKSLNHYKSCDSRIFISQANSRSREVLYKQHSSESRRKDSATRASIHQLLEMKKNPELYKKLLDAAMALEKTQTTVLTYEFHFNIHYETLFGERIVITGEPEFLGHWDPLKGLELEWHTGGFWKAGILLGEGLVRDFDYKYVCIKKQGMIWERGENRSFRLTEGVKQNSHIVCNRQDFWQE